MTRKTRRLIFYCLVLLFLIATPPTIFYAMGYSFDWQTKTLAQSGGFYFKSLPDAADIFINGQNQKTTPRLISRLAPKTYDITISKNGFSPWHKNLEIEPSLVAEARNIILFPQNIQPEKIANTTSTITDFLATPEENKNQLQAKKIATSTAGWLNKGNDIFYVSNANFILYRQDLGGFIKEQLSKETLPKENYKIINSSNGRFLALDGKGALYLLNKNTGIFEQVADRVKDASFSGDDKKILIRKTNEIRILYIEDILIQPYKKTGEEELITRSGQTISQAVFYPDNEHIAFVASDQIKIIELDGRDSRNSVDFVSAPAPQIYFDGSNSSFYYLSKNELFRVKLEL